MAKEMVVKVSGFLDFRLLTILPVPSYIITERFGKVGFFAISVSLVYLFYLASLVSLFYLVSLVSFPSLC